MSDKPHLNKENTMVTTAKIGKEILAGEKLGDTRLATTVRRSKKLQKATTMDKTIEEAKILLGQDTKLTDASTGRTLRARPNPSANQQASRKRKTKASATTAKKSKATSGPAGDAVVNS